MFYCAFGLLKQSCIGFDSLTFQNKTNGVDWAHDILLCREMLAINPFSAKWKTIQRTKIWETVLQYLEEIEEPPFKVTVRAVHDRYTLLSKKFRKRTASEQKASGISPKMSELDILLEELTGVEDQSEEERLSESEEKTRRLSNIELQL